MTDKKGPADDVVAPAYEVGEAKRLLLDVLARIENGTITGSFARHVVASLGGKAV